jgi:hypothetical protein
VLVRKIQTGEIFGMRIETVTIQNRPDILAEEKDYFLTPKLEFDRPFRNFDLFLGYVLFTRPRTGGLSSSCCLVSPR